MILIAQGTTTTDTADSVAVKGSEGQAMNTGLQKNKVPVESEASMPEAQAICQTENTENEK